jgi:CheY-like chemotaxis protein
MDIIRQNPQINLVLSDVMMEGMSGYDLLLNIRKLRKSMSVVLISAYESIDLVESCIQSGADAYLIKPLRMHELRNIWQYAWRRKHEAMLQLRNLSLLRSTAQDIGTSEPHMPGSSATQGPAMHAPDLAGASKMKGERQRLASRLSDMQELDNATRQVCGYQMATRPALPAARPSLDGPMSAMRLPGMPSPAAAPLLQNHLHYATALPSPNCLPPLSTLNPPARPCAAVGGDRAQHSETSRETGTNRGAGAAQGGYGRPKRSAARRAAGRARAPHRRRLCH